MIIYLHTRELAWGEWESRPVELDRIPTVGEHLILDEEDNWYEVRAVVHSLLEQQKHALEIYAVKVEKLTVVRTL